MGRPWTKNDDVTTKAKPSNPLTEEYLRKKPKAPVGAQKRGDLSSSSIFEDEEIVGPKPEVSQGQEGQKQRWERKMVIRDIHKRGRLTKTQQLKREERVLLSKSHDFQTSVKKLVPLAKQIAGKTVEEAIVQMRFSKKKVAKDVKEHLEHARNEAIIRRGMGLGQGVKGAFQPRQILTKDGKRV